MQVKKIWAGRKKNAQQNVWGRSVRSLNKTHTLPETNIALENRPSQKESSLPTIYFQRLC